MSNEVETKNSKKITRKDLNKVFWRLQIWGLNVTSTLVLTQAIGFLNAMVPIIRRLYGDNKELRIEAMKRHLTYFLSQITATGMILGITAAVEETTSEDEKEAVVAIKAGMMGPLAGIGDSVFKITIQAIAGSIGAAYALQGNVLGPILMFVIYNGINIVVKYYGIIFGYEKGTEFIKSGNQKKVMQKIINISTAIGVMVIGALIAQYVKINVGTVIYTKGTKIVIQKLLDGVMPKLLPLLFTLGLYKLHSYLPRKYLTWLIFAILILGTVLAVMGIIK
ncbi:MULTISPECIES: PTS system mannose/fructose/sorbose family transporter subunit IID [Lactobacillus]|uniref:PTS Man IID n=2 Tax=Lactobacillus TaxID=1578 RepID=A0A0F4LCI1_9LACO|nr:MULTISPECIES: PTS system mannose/fructose/sorbose family transporter subunit IID [Lactobacillus]KJY55266.1 PTS Man IID [Lactobacillus melliventris]KJY63113.1 PTS Man IID [Lactobacillus helsingborgensis]MBC6349718.1 PTS system mannose/fructose/sorbose family transporter subunit IID [Lactobacillus melliventris]MBH9990094.1 PTS system mannose/fructose/sorbose family transporter subunit IID [Lactobacillus sp. M0392]MBI0024575.1 PTS system mannose/fructose/sorbose family transporter subunit IID 